MSIRGTNKIFALKMNILLINPPSESEIIADNPSFIEKERGCTPPLGILYIAAYIREKSEHSVNVIDSQVDKKSYRDLKKAIQDITPDIVGISCITLNLNDTIKTAKLVKQISSKIKVIVGGQHVYLYPKETYDLGNIDFIIRGEGEITFLDIINNITDTSKLRSLKGLFFKYNNKYINNGVTELINSLDDLPFPARDLVPYNKYKTLLSNNETVTSIITSRGCPFKCIFCNRPHLGNTYRERSPENVLAEMKSCVSLGITNFVFCDDTFSLNLTRAKNICKLLIKSKLNISFSIRTRVDSVDETLIGLLKKAGCKSIHYGVESGSSRILKILKKEYDLSQICHAFKITKANKIQTMAYIMIGNPSENKSDIKLTKRIIKTIKPDYLHLTILTIFPGTEIYKNAISRKIIKKNYWENFAKQPRMNFIAPYWEETFTKQELNSLLKELYVGFYFNPYFSIKILLRIRSLQEFMQLLRTAIRVLIHNS